MTNSQAWTRLVRFLDASGKEHLGQPVDPAVNVGLAVAEGKPVEVYLVQGDLYDGVVTSEKSVIGKLLGPVSQSDCNIVRCLGLNFMGKIPNTQP